MAVSKRLHGKSWLHHLMRSDQIRSDFNSFARLSTDNSTEDNATDDDSTDTASPPTKSPPSQDDNTPAAPPPPPPNTDNGSDNDNSSGKGNNNNNNDDKTSPSTSPPTDNNNGNKNNNNNNNNNNSNNNNDNNNNKSLPRNSRDPSSPLPPKSGRPMFTPPPRFQKAVGNGDSSSKQEETRKIVAGVVGVGALLLLIILILLCCLCKKRKKDKRYANTMKYMPDDNKGAGQQQYYGNNAQWQGNQQHNQAGNYSAGTGTPSQQSWGPLRPPPPPMGMNSEMMSTGQYSSGQAGPILPPPPPPTLGGFNKSTFTYEELAVATNNFSQDNILGQGGFGYVHKGVLPNGKEIAVKSLKTGSGQGEREFQAEVEIISRVHHRYLVSLVGYCIAGGQRMLVYEFIANGTLEYHLHIKGHPVMDFATRMKIALGSAKGLAYLHEDCHPRIIHRDIKGANILLENNYEAKVADFGLAKLSNDTNTHVSTRIMGTFGYLAPEYAASGKLTEKSDVFSFGVMLLELVTGKRPIDPSAEEEDTLVDWARPLIPRALEEGILNGLVDPRLQGDFDIPEMTRLIACAGAAVRHSGKRRPKMSQIVRALEGDMSIESLYEPTTKAGLQSGANSEYNTEAYNKDISNFRKAILNDSTDYSSSSDHSENLRREQ